METQELSSMAAGTIVLRQVEMSASAPLSQAELAKAVSQYSLPDGPAAAAILSAGIGSFALGLFATLGDAFPAISHFFTFYRPTGALSGVTVTAIAVWLLSWYALSIAWGRRNVSMARVNVTAFVLLALGLLLTFPPFMDFIQGK